MKSFLDRIDLGLAIVVDARRGFPVIRGCTLLKELPLSVNLSRAATRAAGDSGAALASALIRAIHSEAPPERWPLPEVVRLLSSGIAERDRQVGRLLDALHRLEEDLARLAEEDETVGEALLPGPCLIHHVGEAPQPLTIGDG